MRRQVSESDCFENLRDSDDGRPLLCRGYRVKTENLSARAESDESKRIADESCEKLTHEHGVHPKIEHV
jgi:hypothetical protein